MVVFFFFQAEDGIRDWSVTGVQTCALPISDVFGSQLDAQVYFNDLEVIQEFGDIRPRNFPEFFPDIFQNFNEFSEIGTRVQIDTPLGNSANVLWGVDYSEEENENIAAFLDPVAFDANRELNIIEEFSSFPLYEIENLGLLDRKSVV